MTPDQQAGERMRSGWCNLYLQGHYHRAGKPGTMTLHPGDLYATREAALADIDPDAPYICTAEVRWEHPNTACPPLVFPPGAKPVPLSQSRRWDDPITELAALATPEAPVLVGMDNPEYALYQFAHQSGMLDQSSLDTSEREAL